MSVGPQFGFDRLPHTPEARELGHMSRASWTVQFGLENNVGARVAMPRALIAYLRNDLPIPEQSSSAYTRRQILQQLRQKVFFMSALRGNIPHAEIPLRRGNRWSGPYGEHLTSFLVHLNDAEFMAQKSQIGEWAAEFGISDLWTGLRDGGLTIIYKDFETLLRGRLASHGARQALTLVANLLGTPPSSIFLIEEPEISLHPEHQVKVVDLFAAALVQGKQIISSTHSQFLLVALGRAVCNKQINSDDINIYHVQKEQVGTTVTPLQVTSSGHIEGWIPSFLDIERDLLKDALNALTEG